MESNPVTPLNMFLLQLDSNIPIDDIGSHAIPDLDNVLDQKELLPDLQTKQTPIQVFIDPSNNPAVSIKRNHESITPRQQIISPTVTQYTNNSNKNLLKLVDPKSLIIKPRSQTPIISQPNNVLTPSSGQKNNNIINKEYLSDTQTNNVPKYFINLDPKIYDNLSDQTPLPVIEENVRNFKCLGTSQMINTTTRPTKTKKPPIVPIRHTKKKKPPIVHETGTNDYEDLSKKTEEIKRNKNYIHISDKVVPPRAIAVLPSILQIRKGDISPRRTLPSRIRFGPVQGVNKKVNQYEALMIVQNMDKPVFLFKDENGSIIHIDTTDEDKSNWISLIELGDQTTANLWLYEENNALYGFTIEPLKSGTVLKMGYSKKYAKDHKLPPGVPVFDVETVLNGNSKQWWCNECHRTLPTASLLQRHLDVYHKDEIITTRKGYRCQHCKRTFSRLFTEKVPDTNSATETDQADPNTTNNHDNRIPSDESFLNLNNDGNRILSDESFQNLNNDGNKILSDESLQNLITDANRIPSDENFQNLNNGGNRIPSDESFQNLNNDGNRILSDESLQNLISDGNRIPSDESFQNFTNSLDFSTNLFDTDRISNIDINMTSTKVCENKIDNEFNPFSVASRDETIDSVDLNIPKWCLLNSGDSTDKDNKITRAQLETCGYCHEVVPKNNRRKHVRVCTSRKLECSCGKSFTNKRIFSNHVRKCPKINNKEKQKEEKSVKYKHKCEVCELSFRRRGMLVNHMWTKHKTVSTAPVEVAISHYPCTACPKLYRSFAKLDRHVAVHHPGVQRVRGVVIKSGVRSKEPASCSLCPRQYATNAKLMQHMRSTHPDCTLGPEIKK